MVAPDLLQVDDGIDAAARIDASPVHNRIRARWSELPAGALRVAQVVLDEPRLVLELPIVELAERAGTSAATVTRFCRQIGYAGYPALRMSVAT